jgi:hypothetical protein
MAKPQQQLSDERRRLIYSYMQDNGAAPIDARAERGGESTVPESDPLVRDQHLDTGFLDDELALLEGATREVDRLLVERARLTGAARDQSVTTVAPPQAPDPWPIEPVTESALWLWRQRCAYLRHRWSRLGWAASAVVCSSALGWLVAHAS